MRPVLLVSYETDLPGNICACKELSMNKLLASSAGYSLFVDYFPTDCDPVDLSLFHYSPLSFILWPYLSFSSPYAILSQGTKVPFFHPCPAGSRYALHLQPYGRPSPGLYLIPQILNFIYFSFYF